MDLNSRVDARVATNFDRPMDEQTENWVLVSHHA